MSLILNICLYLIAQAKRLVNTKAVLRTVILSFFLLGQIGSTAHAHEHDGETHQTVCEYCILAIQEDFDTSDKTDELDGPNFLKTSDAIPLNCTALQGVDHIALYADQISPRFCNYLDPARAPPLN